MKRVLIFILLLVLLAGCGSPKAQVTNQVATSDCKELQGKYDALQFNFDSLKRASLDSKEMLDKYNGMINEHQSLRVENAALKGQIETLTSQYQYAVNALTSSQKSGLESLEDMDRQLADLNKLLADTIARHKLVDDQIQLVRSEKVKLLSDNLTADEYKAFYKGWGLWWGTFNSDNTN